VKEKPVDVDVDGWPVACPERLPRFAIAELRKSVAGIFPSETAAARQRLVVQLRYAVFNFCYDEARARELPPTARHKHELKALLKPIDAAIDRLMRLSPGARAAIFDFEIEPGFELPLHFLKAARPFKDWSGDKMWFLSGRVGPRPPVRPLTRPPAPKCWFLVDPARLMNMRLRARIALILELDSPRRAGGRPLKLPWHNLASHVAVAMRGSLRYQPTARRSGKFERLLAQCLRIGLDSIGATEEPIPSDLRPYTRRALRD
jgi:hypothetical protein